MGGWSALLHDLDTWVSNSSSFYSLHKALKIYLVSTCIYLKSRPFNVSMTNSQRVCLVRFPFYPGIADFRELMGSTGYGTEDTLDQVPSYKGHKDTCNGQIRDASQQNHLALHCERTPAQYRGNMQTPQTKNDHQIQHHNGGYLRPQWYPWATMPITWLNV